MPLPQEQIDYIKNYLYPYKFTNNKTIIVNFLTEIYANIYIRCNTIFDSYTFNEVINLPMIISDKIYNALATEEKKLSLDDFSQGIYEMFFAPIKEKALFIFDVFDFNKDNFIERNDVFLLLSHFHLIENTTHTIIFLEELIENFFGYRSMFKKEEFLNIIQNKNADVFILMIIFINNYTTIIKDNELRQYKESINYQKFENYPIPFTLEFISEMSETNNNNLNIYNNGNNNNLSVNYNNGNNLNVNNNNNIFHYKITSKLLKYIQKVKLLDFDEYNYNNDYSSDDSIDEFEDLNNFEMDIQDCLQSLLKPKEIKPKLLEEISTNRYKDQEKILIHITPKNSNKFSNGKSIFFKNKETHTSSSKNLDIYVKDEIKGESFSTQENSYRKTYQIGKKKEIIVNKFKNGKKMEIIIKLVLVNYYIFYFKKSGNNFLFKKIIPLFSLFAKKQQIENNLTLLTFSSTLHNFDKQYSFVTENQEEADKFYQWFNKNSHHKDINDYFSFKCELGKGKFGHVYLAERLKDKKLFAIKSVLKCNPTEEEYKINRWESTIFNCLKNIKNENVVKAIQRFESEKKIFFVFEYVKGSDLKTYMKSYQYNKNINSLSNIINITFQILKGVQCLHKYGIIHRDIKSANIMVNEDFKEVISETPKDSVKIVDFGLSRILGKFEYSEDPYGSLCFKAPELIKHIKYNFKVDIWAIGVTLFYITYGELPFEKGDKEEIKNSIIYETPSFYSNNIISDFHYIKDLNEVDNVYITKSSVLYSIIKDCLEKNKDKRPDIDQLIDKYVKKFRS